MKTKLSYSFSMFAHKKQNKTNKKTSKSFFDLVSQHKHKNLFLLMNHNFFKSNNKHTLSHVCVADLTP